MAYNFPNSPSNGDTVTVNGVVYTYNSTDNAWKSGTGSGPAILSDGSTPSLATGITASEIRTLIGAGDLTSVASDIIPDGNETRDLGSSTKKFKDLYLSGTSIQLGNQTISADSSNIIVGQLKIGSTGNQVTLSVGSGGGLETGGTPVFSGAFSALTGKPTTISGYGITDAFDGVFASLSSKPTTIAGYGITDAFSGAFSALTGKPTTIAGYGITDAFSGAFSALTGKPTTIAGYGITDAFSGAFSALTGKPTTVAGYGITDAAPLASPALTGTPTAPTAASGTNTTQLATTAFVQGAISGFSSGDSQRSYTASGAITDKNAVVLNSNGTVSNVSVVAAGINTSTRPLHTATNYAHNHSGVDWNSTDSVYHHAWRDNATLYIKAESPNFSALTLSQSVITTTSLGGTANSKLIYKHIDGTSTGILVYNVSGTYYAKYITYDATTPTHNIGTNTYTLPAEPFDVVIKDSGRMFILYGDRVDSIAIDATAKTFSLTDNTTVGLSSTSAHVFRLFWDSTQSKLITFRLSGTTNQYQYISESSGSLTASSVVTASSTIAFHQIEYHPGLSTYFGFRWQFVRTGNEDRYYPYFTPLTVGASAVTYGTEVQAPIYLSQYDAYNQHSGSGDMRFIPSKTGNSVSLYHLMRIASSGAESQGREHFAFGTLNSSGTYTSSSGFTSMIGVNSGDQAGTSAHDFGTSIDKDGYAYVSYPISYGSGGSTTKVASTLIRTASVSTAPDYLGIAQNAASDGGTVTVMLAGGISTGHSSLTQDVKYYVQNNGSLGTTSTSTLAGHSVSTDSIQVADSQGTFAASTAFADLTSTPTTLSGYGITDALSSAGNVDIGSSNFITTGKSYFANMFSALSDLPSATTYHGMFAHVHATGAGYFAHGGNWIELANKSYVDTEVAGIVDSAPGTLNTLNELAAALNDDANFATTVTNSLALKAPLASPALTGTPTAPTASSGTNTTQVATTAFVQQEVTAAGSYNDASVDTHLNTSTASTNEVLSWNGSDYDWVAQSGGGGASVSTSDAAPSSPSAGDLWYNTNAGGLFVYYQDANSAQWVEVVGKTGATGATGAQGPAGSSAAITRYANVAGFPGSPTAADLAYANDTNTLYLYNGTSWEVVASGNDESPVILTDPPTTHNLDASGSTTSISMAAQDPEGFDITYGIAYKTTGNVRPTQLGADTTINQSTGAYTFTPSTNTAHSGTFKARLSASDGARTTTRFVDVTLDFSMDMEYLVVAGGGGGGGNRGGGGGAGGLLYAPSFSTDRGRTYTITVGTGGGKGDGWFTGGSAGTNSEISATGTAGWTTVTAIGGGVGAQYGGGGGAGGSGGGASLHTTGSYNYTGGAGTSGQGNNGGTISGVGGAGGGGAGGVGGNSGGGAGGVGVSNSITGTAVFYAGGGGGGESTPSSSGGAGGNGGGGTGGDGNGTAGTNGLGGGGGGGGDGNGNTGGDGGSGVVIIRTTATALSTTGSPTVTQDGNHNIYKFTADGTIAF